jgi:Ca2+-binding RTX toxin-like protein
MRKAAIGFLGAATAAALIAPAMSGAGDIVPTCHGKPATVVGTPGDDYFSFADLSDGDVVVALDGDDTVTDASQDVTVCGNAGEDHIFAYGKGLGQQTVFDGGSGADRIGDPNWDVGFRSRGPLTLYGGAGGDYIRGGGRGPATSDGDRIFAGDGADRVYGIYGPDLIHGDDGPDQIYGTDRQNQLYGDRGNDFVRSFDQADSVYGGGGKDGLRGGAGSDYADGGPEFDRCGAETEVNCEADPLPLAK